MTRRVCSEHTIEHTFEHASAGGDLESRLDEREQQARVLAMRGDWGEQALHVNGAILLIDIRSVPALNRLARCNREAGRWDQARSVYMNVLEIDPRNRTAIGGFERCIDARIAEHFSDPAHLHAPRG